MNNDWLDFFTSSFQTFEHFQQELEKEKDIVHIFLHHLPQTDNYEIEIFDELRAWINNLKCSTFPENCLHFYKWLVSQGYTILDANQIESFFKFLNVIRIPDYTASKIIWGVAFLVQDKLAGNDEHFWEKTILKRFNLIKNNILTFSMAVDYFMVYHIGLKQLIKNDGQVLTEIQQLVLTSYMNLVSRFHQLEELFGVTIEKDIFRVYNILKYGKTKQ